MIFNSFLDFNSENFLQIGNFVVKWYAICILIGILGACVLGVKEAKRFGISSNLIFDGVLICVPLAIIGARLYFVFTKFSNFIGKNAWETFLNILGFENGEFKLAGLAINGGIIVAILFVIIYCYKRKMNTMAVFDLLAPGLLIGQICGRWGNFFNQEAHGPAISEKTLTWINYVIPQFIMKRMDFYDYDLKQQAIWHPTFLYESLWNLVGLVTILVSRRINKRQRLGDSVCFYLIWYGLGRSCIIEPLRMDPLLFSEALGPDLLFNRVNVVMNLGLALIGIIWLVLKHTVFKEPFYIETQRKIKENRIDGVVLKLEGTLVCTDRLVKNAYYYTYEKFYNKSMYDDELAVLVDKKAEEVFEGNLEAIEYFNNYFYDNLNQITILQNVRDIVSKWYGDDINIAVVTNYSKEFAFKVLEYLKIIQYVSIIIDKDINEGNGIKKGINSLLNAKKIMVVCNFKDEILETINNNAIPCAFINSKEYEEVSKVNIGYTINRFNELENIIIC